MGGVYHLLLRLLAWTLPGSALSGLGADFAGSIGTAAQAFRLTTDAGADRVVTLPGWDGPIGFHMHAG